MRVFGRIVPLAAMLMALTDMAGAADVRVLSVGAVQAAIGALAAEFEKETGNRVIFSIGSPAAVMQRIKAGEIHDAVIVSEPAMDQLDGDGLVNPESRVRLASTGAGAAERGEAPFPDLSTPQTYEGALMSDGAVPQEARAFIRFLASPEARQAWLAARLEPVPDN
jgi:ABC-type molybdate transport system substrate-binding protein